MNELQRLLTQFLPATVSVLSAKREKSTIKGRNAKDVVVFVRDMLSGKQYKCEWAFADDLHLDNEHVVHLMAKGIMNDINHFRSTNG